MNLTGIENYDLKEYLENRLEVTQSDKNWLYRGVVSNLVVNHKMKFSEAKQLFNSSPLFELLNEVPEEIFHHDTHYWADYLINNWSKL